VAAVVESALKDFGLVGWPKTSGSRGIHVYVRIERRWTFGEVRRAALAFAREVERRAPALATSKWWKEERHGVFLDYNQNAKDRTIASAYSVRPKPDARVSAPLTWEEIRDCEPADFNLKTMPDRFREIGDRHGDIDRYPCSIEPLLELSQRHEKAGMERWRARHAEAAAHLEPADVLVDAMRGRFATWTRIRVNLQHVPVDLRPVQEALDPNDAPRSWGPHDEEEWKRHASTRARADRTQSVRRRPRKSEER
jgi:bifunctional non-homologous end joining protein LigD